MFTASMRFDLGEDVAALRESVQRWAQERLKPMAAAIDRDRHRVRHILQRIVAGHGGAHPFAWAAKRFQHGQRRLSEAMRDEPMGEMTGCRAVTHQTDRLHAV